MKIIKGDKLYTLVNEKGDLIAQGSLPDMELLKRQKSLVGLHMKVSHSIKQQLKDLSDKHKKSMTEIVLEGIELYKEKHDSK